MRLATEDLAQLKITSPTDRRGYDSWAFDDDFCSAFLTDTAVCLPKTKVWMWRRAIEIYWRGGQSRRELANDFGLSLDAVKSLLTTIRKSAQDFTAHGRPASEPVESSRPSPKKWTLPHVIREGDILALAYGDEETSFFVEEYRRVTTEAWLQLFDSQVSSTLIQTLRHSEAIGKVESLGATPIAIGLVSKAVELKLSVAKDDPFEGRAIFTDFGPTPVQYENRGRPRKESKSVPKVKRKRGRPRKSEKSITLPIADAMDSSEFFKTQIAQEPFCAEVVNA